MTTGKNKSPPRKSPKPTAAAKPRAIIEGSVKDVTPGAKEEKITAGNAAPKNPRPGEKKPEPRPSAARRPRLDIGLAVAAGLAGSVATLVIVALVVGFAAAPRTWLARATGAEETARLAGEATVSTQNLAARLEQTIAEQQSQLNEMQTGLAEAAALRREIADFKTRLAEFGEVPAQTTALALRLEAAETRLDTLTANAATRGETVNSLARALDRAARPAPQRYPPPLSWRFRVSITPKRKLRRWSRRSRMCRKPPRRMPACAAIWKPVLRP